MSRRRSAGKRAPRRRRKPKPPTSRPIVVSPVQVSATYLTVPVGPEIAVVRVGDLRLGAAEIVAGVEALARQANEHFGRQPPFGYGIGARMRFVDDDDDPPRVDEWLMLLHAGSPDLAGAAAYHDVTPSGRPMMYCFPDADRADGAPWTLSASHELLETLLDPFCCRAAQAPDGRFWALEVCDSVERDLYMIDGFAVSNWCRPLYFEPTEGAGVADFDHMGLVQQPFEIRPGGYGQFWDGRQWAEVFNSSDAPRTYRKGARLSSRRARRRARIAKPEGR